ncbi:MAG TPA: FCD domain-containing protein [Asanoa sp.]
MPTARDGTDPMAAMPMWRPVRGANAFETTVSRLAQVIRLGIVEVGARLPAERELAERLKVSRVTLREAIAALREAGFLESRRGRNGGTFVIARSTAGERSETRPLPGPSAEASRGSASRAREGGLGETVPGGRGPGGRRAGVRVAGQARGGRLPVSAAADANGSAPGRVPGTRRTRRSTGLEPSPPQDGAAGVIALDPPRDAHGGRVVGETGAGGGAAELARQMGATLHDALDFRRVLEPGAASLAASRTLSAGERRELVARLTDSRDRDPASRRGADSRLHLAIATASGSPSLAAAVADVQVMLDRLLAAIPVIKRNLDHSDAQHNRIVDAILAGDAGVARATMEEHCDATAELLRGLLG